MHVHVRVTDGVFGDAMLPPVVAVEHSNCIFYRVKFVVLCRLAINNRACYNIFYFSTRDELKVERYGVKYIYE